MSRKQIKNVSDSVHAQLVQYAHTHGQNPELIFTKYALERFLYRLSKSDYQSVFILKGAALFSGLQTGYGGITSTFKNRGQQGNHLGRNTLDAARESGKNWKGQAANMGIMQAAMGAMGA